MRGEAVAGGWRVCFIFRLNNGGSCERYAKPLVQHLKTPCERRPLSQTTIMHVWTMDVSQSMAHAHPLCQTKVMVIQDALGWTTFLRLRKRYVAAIITHMGMKITVFQLLKARSSRSRPLLFRPTWALPSPAVLPIVA